MQLELWVIWPQVSINVLNKILSKLKAILILVIQLTIIDFSVDLEEG